MPRCLIIAGPNGAGKTTFALEYLPQIGIRHFINADQIAKDLSPLAPESQSGAAGRLYLKEIDARIGAGEDFAFETTLSGRHYLPRIKRWRNSGWTVELIYLALPDVAVSKARVAERVTHGGHNIPEAEIERRFAKSLRNLFVDFSQCTDYCLCAMNLTEQRAVVFERNLSYIRILNAEFYEKLLIHAGLYKQNEQ